MFSPECGGLLAYPLIELCYSGKYTKEIVTKVSSAAGMYDYLGTKDMIEIQNRVDNGTKNKASSRCCISNNKRNMDI
ncbi:MAG: hypothetical protein ACLTK8_00100 [Paeniclostridium sp.]